jgi:hypothetical protein
MSAQEIQVPDIGDFSDVPVVEIQGQLPMGGQRPIAVAGPRRGHSA